MIENTKGPMGALLHSPEGDSIAVPAIPTDQAVRPPACINALHLVIIGTFPLQPANSTRLWILL